MTLTTSNTRFGANFNPETGLIDFRLFSASGTAALLCVFDVPLEKDAVYTFKMAKEEDVFTVSLNPDEINGLGANAPLYYGFRVFGPNYEYSEKWRLGSKEGFISKIDSANNRFNPNKLAYDPYSKELSHLHSDVGAAPCGNFEVSPNLTLFRSGEKYFEDNQKLAPKSVFKQNPDIEIIKTSKRALKDEIIGEVHLKSLTMLGDSKYKGTFKAAGEFAANIKALGVTMVEFLPLHEFDNKEDGGNYWGYMPLCYFAPHKKYAFNQNDGDAILEFREMINALHKEDIRVCLDVVYNHTGEARIYNNDKEDVNLFSYALIDNAGYYKMDANGFYAASSGCHNDSNTAKAGFKNIIVDSLEYWIKQGVDAFRFDLATSLMDTDTGAGVNYDKNRSIVGALKKELEARGIKVNKPDEAANGVNLIAEPWTCGGHNAYQLGNFPEFFAEWNDVSRNTIRAFSVRPWSLDPLAIRYLIEGTPHKFENPFKAVNYVSCHDGFTLYDLNSYDKKAESTCGGSDWEFCSSYNGDAERRAREIKNQILLLALSAGCFMVQIDDIVLHSKGGNNNSYNLDNSVNYIDFTPGTIEKQRLSEFIKAAIAFRRDLNIFKSEKYTDMDFFDTEGRIIKPENTAYWTNAGINFLSFISGEKDGVSVFAALNKGDTALEFTLPAVDKKYHLVADTKDFEFCPAGVEYAGNTYKMAPHSVVLMLIK